MLLLRAIADLDPNEGLMCLDGHDRSIIAGPEWRRLVGYVPAEPGWWADTVGKHFNEWMAALPLIRELGFPEEAKAWPIGRLSTGERLQLALVRALRCSQKCCCSMSLPLLSVATVESLIATRVRAGLAVLWVTHDTEQARRIVRRLLVVKAGEVLEEIPEWQVTSP
jgi:phosphate-transporting ATPase